MEGAEFSCRHFDFAFTDNFERQIKIESGDCATIIPFAPRSSDHRARLLPVDQKSGSRLGVTKSGCQNGFAFVFQKLGRMGRAINRGFDSQDILLGWILGCEHLACQCSRSVLAFASQHILPDGAISGWDWPFRPGNRGAKHYAKKNRKETRHTYASRSPLSVKRRGSVILAVGTSKTFGVEMQSNALFANVPQHLGRTRAFINSR